jgi:hypothetical protein
MTDYIFYLNDTEVDEPSGWDGFEVSIKRDEKYHGMTFEAATTPLSFYGEAAAILEDAYLTDGVKANVTFHVEYRCEGNYDYIELYRGRLNFGKYKKTCGSTCLVTIPVEEESCHIILKSRFDQKVDVDSLVAADGQTPLQEYEQISVETDLPAHNLLQAAEGLVAEGGDRIDLGIFAPINSDFWVRATYANQLNASLNETQLIPTVFAAADNGLNDSVISPVVLLDDIPNCFNGNFTWAARLKGSYDIGFSPSGVISLTAYVATGEFPGTLTVLDSSVIESLQITPVSGTFDINLSGTTTLAQGAGFYVYLHADFAAVGGGQPDGFVEFDPETYVNFEGVQSCPTTQAELSGVHETLSRVTESITNGCMRVKSEFYGRTDSEPFAFPADGCGGLRTLTSGLKIRKAEEDKFFASLKDLMDGLNPIDNIGIGVEDDPDIPGRMLLRVEDLDFFYRNEQLMRHDGIPKADIDVEEQKHYSRILVGYKKWEVEDVKGLDEFNSNREYKTSIDTVNSTLDITSNFVAGSYPIEITRQQSFATSGGADTKYDNDIFIISMERKSYPYGNMQVEQGNITNPQNIFSPDTIYNYRLSPLRNLMRWYRSIGPAFASLFDTANKLFFSSGTGNLIASGIMESTSCRQENAEVQENQNIFVTNYANTDDYTPLWKNELLTYTYPMSVADYEAVKANPYGYIEAQCGNGAFEKFWIQEIKFKLTKGEATFILRKKYAV